MFWSGIWAGHEWGGQWEGISGSSLTWAARLFAPENGLMDISTFYPLTRGF
jgi:hypothetical protein